MAILVELLRTSLNATTHWLEIFLKQEREQSWRTASPPGIWVFALSHDELFDETFSRRSYIDGLGTGSGTNPACLLPNG